MNTLTARTFSWSGALTVLALALWLAPARWATADTGPPAGVGLNGEVKDVLLPGPALRVKPDPEGRSPVVVRLTASYPHGTAGHRYDLSWFAYTAGTHNLAEYLERADGSPAPDLPAIPVEAQSILPPGPPGMLADFNAPTPSLGGYRTALIAGGALWLAGLVGLLCWRRPKPSDTTTAPVPELPLAERLRSLVDQARAGTLDADGKARLERLVLGFWRDRLQLTTLPIPEAVRTLRTHPEAGGLLRQVEEWLHSGRSTARESDVAALLAPYLDPSSPGTTRTDPAS